MNPGTNLRALSPDDLVGDRCDDCHRIAYYFTENPLRLLCPVCAKAHPEWKPGLRDKADDGEEEKQS